jgi:hypothetical protein
VIKREKPTRASHHLLHNQNGQPNLSIVIQFVGKQAYGISMLLTICREIGKIKRGKTLHMNAIADRRGVNKSEHGVSFCLIISFSFQLVSFIISVLVSLKRKLCSNFVLFDGLFG